MLITSFEKITQGSFNQSHSMFGDSVGKQCATCSLYAIYFTLVRFPGHWNVDDLDFIVNEGDKLYKSLNKSRYLLVTDLPQIVSMFGFHVNITYLENEFGFLSFNLILVFYQGKIQQIQVMEFFSLLKDCVCVSIICKKMLFFCLTRTVEITWVSQLQMAFQC